MRTGVSLPSAVQAVERACASAATADDLFEAVSAEVRRVVPHDAYYWFGVDPATLLATAPGRVEGLDAGYCDTLWHNEFHEQDALLFSDLARQPVPAAGLRLSTEDRPGRSARYREFIVPQLYEDELRAVLRSCDASWGIVGLYRESCHDPFDADEVAYMGAISATVASALRVHIARLDPWLAPTASPGLMLFDGHANLISANREATEWLDDMSAQPAGVPATDWASALAPGGEDLRVPPPIYPLIARARAVADGRERSPARLRVRDRRGRWLVLHASCLAGASDPRERSVAVVIEPAGTAEVAPMLLEALALSPREREVVGAICRGLSTAEMAAELYLSPHTVRDYVKAVFEKVGVSSRGELVARLYAEHYNALHHSTLVEID
jgi:DNA-binding CsgD family transcriptional regulator